MDGLGLQPAPPPRTPLSARAFGPEVLLGELIGRGGMSRVYRGWLRAGGSDVAVKVLRDDLSSAPHAVQRFIRERDLLAAVAGPHVVRVHDLVVHGDEIGIVMDLVAGGHLRQSVTFPCPPAQAARLTAQIADGLAAVHATGVVHRDLKPENVLVDRDEAGDVLLRLTDFGISRLVDTGTLTQTTVTGTPGYLSPEVAAGGKVTAAADVYALGVVLYELCTGRGPFLADNPLVLILNATRQEAPRPGGMPDALWNLLAAMLAKNPTDRPHAAEVGDTLRVLAPALGGVPVCSPPSPSQDADADLVTALPPPAGAPPSGEPVPGEPPPPPRRRGESRRRGEYRRSGYPAEPVAPDRDTGRGRVRRRLTVLAAAGGATAAVAVVAVIGVIGVNALVERETPVVPVPIADPPSPTTAAPSQPPSPRLLPPSGIHRDLAPILVTISPSLPVASGDTTTALPSANPSPGAPSLSRTGSTPQDLHSSDRRARLTIGNVMPENGTITSITVTYGGRTKRVPVGDGLATSYRTVVGGLTNGTSYTFTATVCRTSTLCADSDPFTFTPYAAPRVQAPVLSVKGLVVNVQVPQVIRNSHPGQTTCALSVTPADPGTPQGRPVDPEGESLTFTGKASTRYTATETCSTDNVSDGSARSNSVTTATSPASPPPPSPTPPPPTPKNSP